MKKVKSILSTALVALLLLTQLQITPIKAEDESVIESNQEETVEVIEQVQDDSNEQSSDNKEDETSLQETTEDSSDKTTDTDVDDLLNDIESSNLPESISEENSEVEDTNLDDDSFPENFDNEASNEINPLNEESDEPASNDLPEEDYNITYSTVTFNSGISTFGDGSTENVLTYGNKENGKFIAHTSNFDDNGNQNGYYYSTGNEVSQAIKVKDAQKLSIDIKAKVSEGNGLYIIKGYYPEYTLEQLETELDELVEDAIVGYFIDYGYYDGIGEYEYGDDNSTYRIETNGDSVTLFWLCQESYIGSENVGYYATVSTLNGTYKMPLSTSTKQFDGWSLQQDGDVIYSKDGSNIPHDTDLTLYAHYSDESFLIDWDYDISDDQKYVILREYHGTNTDYRAPSKATIDGKEFDVAIAGGPYPGDSWYYFKTKNIVNLSFEDGFTILEGSYLFEWNYNLKSVDFTGCHLAESAKSMDYMMHRQYELEYINLGNLNTSNIESMDGTFWECGKLKKIDNLTTLDTSNVTDMQFMFQECTSLESLDLSNFNTEKVIYMRNLFCDCKNLTSLDLSSFDTSNVIEMENMFNDCNKLTYVDISSFDTSKVQQMWGMFFRCYALEEVDLSNFTTECLLSTSEMFYDCYNLKSVNIANFKMKYNFPENISPTYERIDIDDMFVGCTNLESIFADEDFIEREAYNITYEQDPWAYHKYNGHTYYCGDMFLKDTKLPNYDETIQRTKYGNVYDATKAYPGYDGYLTQWNIRFSANGGQGEDIPFKNMALEEKWNLLSEVGTRKASTNNLQREGYTFIGWALSEDGNAIFKDGDEISADILKEYGVDIQIGTEITLYAKWEHDPVDYSLTYDTLGGSTISEEKVSAVKKDNYSFTLAKAPTKSGYTFLGWSTQKDATSVSYKSGESIVAYADNPNITVYAVWQKANEVTPTSKPTPTSTPNSGCQNGTVWNENTGMCEVVATPTPTNIPTPVVNPNNGGIINTNPVVTPTVTPSQESDNTTVEQTPTPTVTPEVTEIKEDETPLALTQNWALLNLVSTLVSIVLAVILLVTKKQGNDEQSNEEYTRYSRYKVFAAISAIASIVIFVLTENMSNHMVLADKYTLVMIVLLAINTISLLLGRQWHQLKKII